MRSHAAHLVTPTTHTHTHLRCSCVVVVVIVSHTHAHILNVRVARTRRLIQHVGTADGSLQPSAYSHFTVNSVPNTHAHQLILTPTHTHTQSSIINTHSQKPRQNIIKTKKIQSSCVANTVDPSDRDKLVEGFQL